MKTTITVKGTHCQSCAVLIKDICSEIPGVVRCDVDVKTGKTVIEHTGKLDLAKIKKEIESVGKYTVVV
ncbi:TPA: heavy-metal-associated domain-containing protein [Candidatus Woesearchaeota archaeon]|nr:heavy-metal-associated domain-containing protein [Candidatus Woesearchaeota archaeon]